MTTLHALLLGLIQGLTEFIPVSSSGHLVLAEQVLHLGASNFVFDTMLNIGTLAALTLYFRRELWGFVTGIWHNGPSRRQVALIALATIPGVIIGLLAEDAAQRHLRSSSIVMVMLVLVGVAMLLAERYGPAHKREKVTLKDSIVIGLCQALAFLPGTSRSGVTITAGVARGLTRQEAATFSFFLALPILGGGVVKVLLGEGVLTQIASQLDIYVVGIAASFASGYAAVTFLLRYLQTRSLRVFAYYRFALAAILAVLLITT